MRHLGVVSLALALAACGGDGQSDFVGIWEPTAWTDNPTACDSPGTSVLEGRTGFFAVLDQKFFGQRFLSAVSCDDLEECRGLFGDENTLHIGNYTFDRGSDDDGWKGTTTYAFADQDDTCTGEVLAHTMRDDGGALVIETIRTEVSGVPLDADGFCDTDEAEALAADAPCTGYEVVTMSRVE